MRCTLIGEKRVAFLGEIYKVVDGKPYGSKRGVL
jgi:hypothetical protein